MDNDMEYVSINIKEEKNEPTSVSDANENNSNNNNNNSSQAAPDSSPDSVEKKIVDQQVADKEIVISKNCCWCQQTLTVNDRPKLLECFHSCCESCLKQEQLKAVTQNQSCNVLTITCPLCKMDNRSDYIINNHFLIEMLNSMQVDDATNGSGTSSSGSAEETAKCANECEFPATSYCVDCSELICDNCVAAHQRLKITKDHTIKSKDAAENKSDQDTKKEIKCQTHPQEILSVYCQTCDRLTCRDCQLMEHREHRFKFANEMAKETRDHLQGLLQEISYKKVLLTSAMKVIDDRQSLIAEKKTELSKEIHDLVAKLASAVSSRGKQLLFRLTQVCENKLQVLNEKKDALQQLSGHTDHCINFVQNALEIGSDSAVLYSKKTLSRHLNKVKCQRADIPNPEIPVRVQLFLSNVPELENVISRIGTILVDGKVYPPAPAAPTGTVTPPTLNPPANPLQQMAQQVEHRSQQQSSRQRQSPTVTPPLRPLLPQPPPNTGYNNNPGMFSSSPQFPQGMRNFPGDSTRFPMPHPAMGPPQPHVSSSTHPSMGNDNLRGLLSHQNSQQFNHGPMANYGPGPMLDTRNMTTQQQQAAMQQMRNTYMNNASHFNANSNPQQNGAQMPPTNAMQQTAMQRYQHMTNAHSFKIPLRSPDTLRNQPTPTTGTTTITSGSFPLPNVSSTNPKTPSPSQKDQQKDLDSIDSVCSDTVNDLLATIAKLDSNGVQVLPEGRHKATSPQVHSSTDAMDANVTIDKNNQPKDDPNEDWCACCMDGGELMCCDKCPKVFHQACHIPVISSLPEESETWQCLLCYNFADAALDQPGEKRGPGLSTYELKVLQRILLEMFCQFELSSEFRVLPPVETNKSYYENVCNPISLNCIREKLDPNHMQHYQSVQSFIDDCRQMFTNAFLSYGMDSKSYLQAQELEKFFEIQLRKLLPKYAKSPSQLARSTENRQMMVPMSLHDLIDDMDDPKDNDYMPHNNPKRKRSTPSV
ncbi:CLUMA_CG004122, isoform A [Clunio marinus]|uniref:CLUMA_CG004122, isoform A n=1 Tax=Clunio marinus TaxID=568069 RepID=A0A1J1HR67_9DIPT|nr:CLUMA_CG004122, isoform A [Clunio marinus]